MNIIEYNIQKVIVDTEDLHGTKFENPEVFTPEQFTMIFDAVNYYLAYVATTNKKKQWEELRDKLGELR